MKKIILSLYLKTKALIKSIKCINNIHLMDEVQFKDIRCFVNNGTSAPIWDLCEIEWQENGTRLSYKVHEDNFKKIKSISNFKNSLFSYYNWYMKCWFAIDLKKIMGSRGAVKNEL